MPYENAHAAHLNDDGVVDEVIVIPNVGDTHEAVTEYCNSVGKEGTWLDTSFVGSRRGKYAQRGDRYDEENDVFYTPEPFVVPKDIVPPIGPVVPNQGV